MHNIILRSLTVRNFLSYGANTTIIPLDDHGITWIKGAMGAGKSTIIEGITLAWFGESYRGLKLTDLANTANSGKMYVNLNYDRIDSNGTVNYSAIREMGSKSMKFILEKDGVPVSKEAGVSQKNFEEDILGFNLVLYKNVISMNTIETTAFIDMKTEDKRKLIESILTLHIDKVKKLNSSEMTLAMSKFTDATSDVGKYGIRLTELNDLQTSLAREQADDVAQLEADIGVNENAVVAFDGQLTVLKQSETAITKNGTDLKTSLNSYSDIESKMAAINALRTSLSEIDGIKTEIEKQQLHVDVSKKKVDDEIRVMNIIQADVAKLSNITTQFEQAKREVTSTSTTIGITEASLAHLKSELAAVKSGIPCPTCGKESTEADIKGIKDSLAERISNEEKNILQYKASLDVSNAKITELTPLVNDYNALMAQYNAKSTEIRMLQSQLSRDESILTNLKSKLVSCNSAIASSSILLGITTGGDVFGDPIDVASDIISIEKALLVRKTEVVDIQNRLIELRGELSTIKSQISSVNTNRNNAITALNQLKVRLAKRKSLSEGTSIAVNLTQIDNAQADLLRAKERVTKYSDRIEVIRCIDKMYGDDGIKKMILNVFVPNLNQVIAHNINLFALPFTIEFDDSLDYKFIGKYGMAQVYKGLSQGQRRMINFAISMAFRDFVALIADFKISVMFLDEVLDVSTDQAGMKEMIDLVKHKLAEIPTILLMSHRGEDFEEEWNHILEVSHDGMYSFVEKLK